MKLPTEWLSDKRRDGPVACTCIKEPCLAYGPCVSSKFLDGQSAVLMRETICETKLGNGALERFHVSKNNRGREARQAGGVLRIEVRV